VCIGQAIVIGEEGDTERQARFVTAFDPITKIVTVDSPWCVVPPNGSNYQIVTLRRSLSETQISAIATSTNVTDARDSILNRIGAFAGSGANTILGFFRAVMRKDVSAPSDVGGNYSAATDSLEAIRDRGDSAWTTGSGGGGGGGGDATLANQVEILSLLTGADVVQVPSPIIDGNLVLTQGDTYDGIGNPKATWNVGTDYTDGWSVALTIRDKDDAIVYQTTGVVENATTITVDIDAPTGLPMIGCPGQWQGKFDVELSKGTAPNRSVKTIASGVAYINEDQTR
jgi:hypothetical protein